MPIVHRDQVAPESPFTGVASRALARQGGANALTVNELLIAPGARVPLHVHPSHEELMVVLEGALEATVGDQAAPVGPGAAVLAPQQVRHMLVNRGDGPARVLAIFPTATPQRVLLDSG